MKKILVTGATGFIGKHLVRRLVGEGNDVIAFDKNKMETFSNVEFVKGDIVSFNFEKILDGVDIVYHLAGLLGTTELFHRVIEAERVNVIGTLNLLESMRRKDVKKIVFTSKPNIWKYNVYTITKENCERYLEMYREIYGFEVVITRPYNVYGPGEMLKEYRKAIPYFIVASLRNKPIEVFGDGKQTMDPIYIDDAVGALILCGKKLPKEVVEIGSSQPITIIDLARKIIKLTNSKSRIVFKPMRKGESPTKLICANGNMRDLIGYTPGVSLERGLSKTIRWYRNHLDEFKQIYEYREEDFLTEVF